MILYPGEYGVCSEQMYAWIAPQQVPGTLYLTNGRLIFETTPQVYDPGLGFGLGAALGLNPQMGGHPMLNLDLRSISNVSALPGQGGWHTLRVEANGGSLVYDFQTPRAQEWTTSIQGARGNVPLASGQPGQPSRPPMSPGVPPAPSPQWSSSPPPPMAPATAPAPPMAPSPIAAAPASGSVYCGRCGKPNPPGGAHCMHCGAPMA
jgi:hypothetical protein